jgi:hypothetical protein
VYAFRRKEIDCPRVGAVQVVPRGQLLQLRLYGGYQLFVFGDARKVCLVVQDFAEAFREVLRRVEEFSECFSRFVHGFIICHSETIEFALGAKINSARLDILALVSVCRSKSRDESTAAFGQLRQSHDECRRASRATCTARLFHINIRKGRLQVNS